MKKKITLLCLILLCFTTSFSQTESKNKEHCLYVQSTKSVKRLKATFEISTLSTTDQTSLAAYFYEHNYHIYKVFFLDANTIEISYLDVLQVDFLKEILVLHNCYIELISILTVKTIQQ